MTWEETIIFIRQKKSSANWLKIRTSMPIYIKMSKNLKPVMNSQKHFNVSNTI